MSLARRVVIVVFDGVMSLDVMGPMEVFHGASRLKGGGEYELEVVAAGADEITMSNGLRLAVLPLPRDRRPIDTLVIAGGEGTRQADQDPELLQWIRSAAKRSRRVTSVCSGAALLAAAGLLDGRRCTTHWGYCETLAERFPAVTVDPDPIFVRDGNVATSAGVTAGMDLSLALVEEDLGAEVARDIARYLVLFLKRPGGQSQFSAQLTPQPARLEPLKDLQGWIADHLDEDLTVPALAQKASMSERTFARAFRRETGRTPAAYVETVRVERARAALEESYASIESVAEACGFGTVETMRRAFHRRLGVGPAAYRSRFAAPTPT